MTTATFDRRTATIEAIANSLHLMKRGFGSKHTPADFRAQAEADFDRLAAEPRIVSDECETDPWTLADENAERRFEMDREMLA